MRLFFAVEFEPRLKDALVDAINATAIDHPPWRWVARSNVHITLKFLGDTPKDQVPQLIDTVASVCRCAAPFDLELGGMGGFPNLKKPRVLFYNVIRGADELVSLSREIDSALETNLSIPREKKPFRAHATVARVKRPIDPGMAARLISAPAVSCPPQRVQHVSLMQSELRREGAIYQLVKEIALTVLKC
jgi:2'-5' RNA ligase